MQQSRFIRWARNKGDLKYLRRIDMAIRVAKHDRELSCRDSIKFYGVPEDEFLSAMGVKSCDYQACKSHYRDEIDFCIKPSFRVQLGMNRNASKTKERKRG